MYVLFLPVLCVSIGNVAAQDTRGSRYEDNARMDSLARNYIERELKADKAQAIADKEQAIIDQERKSSDDLSNLKSEKSKTKAKAKEAQRVENDANDAAHESKVAYRTEKKAQKARNQADKQAKKAAKARTTSDNNWELSMQDFHTFTITEPNSPGGETRRNIEASCMLLNYWR